MKWLKHVGANILVGAAYMIGAYVGLRLAFDNRNVTAFWPPTGISLAALFIFGPRIIPAIAIGAFSANLINGAPLPTSVGIVAGNTLAPTAAYFLLRRFLFQANFERIRDPILLVFLGALVCTLISATLGTTALGLTGELTPGSYISTWLVWWIGDAMGVVLFAPLLLIAWSIPLKDSVLWQRKSEGLATLILATAAAYVLLLNTNLPNVQIEFALFPMILWIALRLQRWGVAITVLIFSALSLSSATEVKGWEDFSTTGKLVVVQLFNGSLALTGYLLAAIANQNRQAKAELEARVHERTLQLEVARQVAEEASRAKSDHLSRMSHELRTPLSVIIGYCDLLSDRVQDESLRMVNAISAAGDHLLRLVNDVLDIARIEAGKLEVRLETVPLLESVQKCVNLVTPYAQEHQINITIDESCAGPVVIADSQRLHQVLLNLLNNAVAYNHLGGKITVSAHTEQSSVRIEVTDTGRGISGEMMSHIWEPFDRAGLEAEAAIPGAGLGLSVAQSLMRSMDGAIGVQSVEQKGSTFWLELPAGIGIGDKVPAAPLPTMAREPRGNYRILYIEDHPQTLELVREVAKMRPNINLEIATNGIDGIAKAKAHKPDLILLDIHLPDIDGAEVINLLNIDRTTSSIPIVIFSADATAIQVERFRSLGVVEYLTKPARVTEILRVFDRIDQLVPAAK